MNAIPIHSVSIHRVSVCVRYCAGEEVHRWIQYALFSANWKKNRGYINERKHIEYSRSKDEGFFPPPSPPWQLKRWERHHEEFKNWIYIGI